METQRLGLLQKEILLFLLKNQIYREKYIKTIDLVKGMNEHHKINNSIYENSRRSIKNLIDKGFLIVNADFPNLYQLNDDDRIIKFLINLKRDVEKEYKRKKRLYEIVNSNLK